MRLFLENYMVFLMLSLKKHKNPSANCVSLCHHSSEKVSSSSSSLSSFSAGVVVAENVNMDPCIYLIHYIIKNTVI